MTPISRSFLLLLVLSLIAHALLLTLLHLHIQECHSHDPRPLHTR